MSIEGRLTIRLKRSDGAAAEVSIHSSRPVRAASVFQGRSIVDSQRMIPLLFSICATAQSCAGVRACEQALGVPATAQTERLRDALVNMETLREHLWRILLDWPAYLGEQAHRQGMAEVVAIQGDYRQALCPGASVFQLGGLDCKTDTEALTGVLQRFDALLQQRIFGMPPGEWLALAGPREFADWVAGERTVAARLTQWVRQAGWGDAGACESEALPPLSAAQLHSAMQNAGFVSQPQWLGQCRETSCLTRVHSPLLRALQASDGRGLLVRLVARLTEIAQLAGRLPPEAQNAPSSMNADAIALHSGVGQVAAARGQLVHCVTLNGDYIGSYQILAPTEWNFHPQGVVVRALCTLRGEPDAVERQARLLIEAIDPCVGYELSVL